MRKSPVALLLLTASGLAQTQVDLREGHPDYYTVVKGDTLQGVSGKFPRQPWEWPELWYVNLQIQSPRPVYPGDTLSLVYVDGQPCLVLNRGKSRGIIKLLPEIRSASITEAIPTIPLGKISSFLLANRIINDEKIFTSTPYIVAGNAGRIISGAGDRIYTRGKFTDSQPAYGIFRQSEVCIGPKTEEVLGINTDGIGGDEVVATEGDVTTLALIRTAQEMYLGDHLFPTKGRVVNSTFVPGEPSREVKGEVIGIPRGVTQTDQFDVVTLDRDQRDGLTEGNALAIYKVDETVRDHIAGRSVKIPDEHTGLLMVFRTYKELSYILVLITSRPLSTIDRVQSP